MTYADLIKRYRLIRDQKEQLELAHKKELEKYISAMKLIEAKFLEYFNETGVDTLTAKGAGTAYRSILNSVRVDDPAAFMAFVREQEGWGLLDARASKAAVTQYLDDVGELPPGVSLTRVAKINFRKA